MTDTKDLLTLVKELGKTMNVKQLISIKAKLKEELTLADTLLCIMDNLERGSKPWSKQTAAAIADWHTYRDPILQVLRATK